MQCLICVCLLAIQLWKAYLLAHVREPSQPYPAIGKFLPRFMCLLEASGVQGVSAPKCIVG
jgi:hypothetical protein